jgi:ribosomal protein S6--L-glutamate ligase
MNRPIAIGARLAPFPEIHTLGVRPNLADYPPEHLELIRRAHTIYYPTQAFAAQFVTMGKRIFPSLECHLYEGDKIKQTILMDLLGLPHPRTRVFYGQQRQQILEYFSFPFVAKTPRASACGRGVFLIRNQAELETYLAHNQPAYIQEYLPVERDLRVLCIGFEPVCAYWRRAPADDWRTNLARGGRPDFRHIPPQAVELAVEAARRANLDDVGVDVIMVDGQPMLLEFNIKYGRKGPRAAGLDVRRYVVDQILAGRL